MARGPKPTPLTLTEDERGKLTAWTARPKTAQALALRARIVLAAADGQSNTAIAGHLRGTLPTVRKWRERFAHRRRARPAREARAQVARALRRPAAGRPDRRAAPRGPALPDRRAGRAGRQPDAGVPAG